jgi:hypothetical protein
LHRVLGYNEGACAILDLSDVEVQAS